MTRIVELQLIYQKPIDLEDYGLTEEDLEGQNVFATEGQKEFQKFVHIGLDQWAENTMEKVKCDLPVGITGSSDLVRRLILRTIARQETWDNEWKFIYVIAKFQRNDKTKFFRTVMPRTEITVQIRRLRHRNQRDR